MNHHHQDKKPVAKHLKDYRTPDFKVESVDCQIELFEDKALVHSTLKFDRNTTQGKHQRPLVLDGEELKLISIELDGKSLAVHDYALTSKDLTIPDVPDHFTLEIVTETYPDKNTTLSGLYRSDKKLFCTQCEAEGFRRITYYLDRPDVMSIFTITIVADKTKYPVLLSNGNRVEEGMLPNNRHWVKWHDPFKKPSYLFALVAGDLAKVTDTYTTSSNRTVALEIYVDHENRDKCEQAISALKKSMKWDEENYGREYDLDVYMIVAVNDFNMGAMENKGLNIFNAKYVLANQETATDTDFQLVEMVIGHEYFHNWTGNRITCRDWFQLSLKEGLTVFREQSFSADMGWPTVKRIQDVRQIRTRQFAEDAGPMAHPVRPDSYIEINNFYTSTVYNKGSEVIRMLHTLLGKKGFRKGMDCYFERHDGQAVTIEDFVASFEDANKIDLQQFYRWYQQAGTPVVEAKGEFNPSNHEFTLTLKQTCPATPMQPEKKPFLIPIKIALYDKEGTLLPLKLEKGEMRETDQGHFLVLKDAETKYVFKDLSQKPIPSLLGNFSAPVKLNYDYSTEELNVLMTHDVDGFNRWDSAQQISLQALDALMASHRENRKMDVPKSYLKAFEELLNQPVNDPALLAQLLNVPSFTYIAETKGKIEVDAILEARKAILAAFSENLQAPLAKLYQLCEQKDDGSLNAHSMGYRALKNVCLAYLVRQGDKKWFELAKKQYETARNMTDKMGALSALNVASSSERETLYNDFYQQWKKDPLVVNKWLSLQALSELPNALDNIKQLLTHEAFDIGNPNKVYALINTFGGANPIYFHERDGKGYDFIADRVIELNKRNPQVAARLLENLTSWKRLDDHHGQLMKKALVKIQDSGSLSEDVYEVVTKSLTV